MQPFHARPSHAAQSLVQDTLIESCVRNGASAFLIKPISYDDVRLLWKYVDEIAPGSGSRSPSFTKRELQSGRSLSGEESAPSDSVCARVGSSAQSCDGLGVGVRSVAVGPVRFARPPAEDSRTAAVAQVGGGGGGGTGTLCPSNPGRLTTMPTNESAAGTCVDRGPSSSAPQTGSELERQRLPHRLQTLEAISLADFDEGVTVCKQQ